MRIIDADAFKADIKEKRDYLDTSSVIGRSEYIALNKALTMLDEQPTVDAKPLRHGEWAKIRGIMPPEYTGLKACSECGWHIYPLGRLAFDKCEDEFRYCPYCGAKMDGEREDDANT